MEFNNVHLNDDILHEAEAWYATLRDNYGKLVRWRQQCNIIGGDFRPDLAQNDIHAVYTSALKLAAAMQQMMAFAEECGSPTATKVGASATDSSLVSADFDSATGALSVRINAAPPLKKQASSSSFLALVCPEVTAKILQVLPPHCRLYTRVYVIYVHHFMAGHNAKTPYFDNDNITIKGVLDAIVPYVCADDAYCYCNNLYVAQADTSTYMEIIVVPQGALLQWAHSRPELTFTQELGGVHSI